MPDSPDYSKYLPGSNRFSLQDMGELAVRLKSPVVYDRRGEVIFYDTFDAGINKWVVTGAGTGNAVRPDPTKAYLFNQSAKLLAGTTSGKYAVIETYIGSVDLKRIGIAVAINWVLAFDLLDINLANSTLDNGDHAVLRLDYTNDKIKLRTGAVTYTEIADFTRYFNRNNVWYDIKMVVDVETHKYVRLMINQETIDISQYDTYDFGPSTENYLFIDLEFTGIAAPQSTINLSHVIVTANEP